MKKKALCIIMIAVIVAAIAAVIVIKNKSFRKDNFQRYRPPHLEEQLG